MKHNKTTLMMVIAVSSAVTVLAATLGAQRGGGTGTGGGTGAGTGGGRGPIAAPPTTPTGATRGGRAMTPRTDTSPAAIAVKNAVARVKAINKAIANLDKLAAKAASKNSPAAEQQQWADQGKWIRALKGRYAAYGEKLDTATKSSADSMDVLLKLTELDEQFIALQVSTDEEAAKFTDLAKAAKSRHDATMKSLKEIK